MKIIILAGGSGTRLWPLSRARYPKQFVKLIGRTHSLFQQAYLRSLLLAESLDIYVVTNERYKFLVMGQLEEMDCSFSEEHILVEPEAKNTLPAIYAGVHAISQTGAETVAVFPSDHLILNNQGFAELLTASETLAQSALVTFGIRPDSAHTGYGYILPGQTQGNGFRVQSFHEKPTRAMAEQYIESGCFWNAGIFIFNTDLFTQEVKKYALEVYDAFVSSISIDESFSKIETPVSVDKAIMEKSDKVCVIPAEIGWSDIGSFDAVRDVFDKDENNNVLSGDAIMMDATGNLVYTEGDKIVAAVGVDDLIIIDNKDALLICKKDESEKVKQVVQQLRERHDPRETFHVQDYRRWGHLKVLEEEKGAFKIKRLTLYPNKKISSQRHQHRSERWIVVDGTARVTVDDEVAMLQVGESIVVKPGQKHQLENVGTTALEIIEVQLGNYLKEDDIVRFDDIDGGNGADQLTGR